MIRFASLCLLLGATALYVFLHPPENLAAGRGVLANVPVTFGAWNGTELSFEDAVVEELEADDLLIRRYTRGPDHVWLCIVYHQNRRYGAHDPRVCYESQGWLVDPETVVRIDNGTPGGLEVNRFLVDRPRQQRLVYYWWSTKDLTTRDRDAFRGRMAILGALDNRSWGAFVRVETPIGKEGRDAAERRLQSFAANVALGLPAVFANGSQPQAGPR
jgi:EpsI family protein